jgi:cell shape-determining protein MreC
MTPEEKVLAEIKEYAALLFKKISELKVTESERMAFEEEKATFQKRLNDYKLHKAALLERERCLSKSS